MVTEDIGGAAINGGLAMQSHLDTSTRGTPHQHGSGQHTQTKHATSSIPAVNTLKQNKPKDNFIREGGLTGK